MKNNAFTLIELLVVVLIIGILAAVALPKYQVAVDKARMSTLLNTISSIAQAQEVYRLANGVYADQFDELDISLPRLPVNFYLRYNGDRLYIFGQNYLPGILLIYTYEGSHHRCYAQKDIPRALALCKSVCATSDLATDGGWKACSF